MINEILLNILKKKIKDEDIIIADIKNTEYKTAIITWLETENNQV